MSDDSAAAAVPSAVDEAQAFFRLVTQAETLQRQREKDDLQFQVPELQWPEDVRQHRKAQIVGDLALPARPMLSIPKLDQPVQLILNQERAAHLGVQVHALSEDATDDTAEVLQGLYRRIEVDSRAGLARSWGFERGVKAGRGCYRVLSEYDPSGGHASDQRIVIKRLLDQSRVYLDPFAQEPDWSDGERALIVDDLPWATYKRKFKDSTLAKWGAGEFEAFTVDGEDPHARWINGDDESTRTIRVAEFFYVEYDKTAATWQDGNGETQTREQQTRRVKWCKVNAIEVLDEGEWPGPYIPIVPVIGRELIPFDSDRRWVGIYGPNKDGQRMFNYAASGLIEQSALETKASHAIDPEAIETFESWWQQKNTRNFPYLPYKRFKNGRDLGEPVPIQADMSKMQANILLLQQAGDFLHAGTGAFEPTLGQNSPNVRTKGATLALQQQHDQGNSNWLDNLAELSLTLEAKIILEAIPYFYDRPGRVARILDIEDHASTVMLNQPFTVDPQTKRPIAYQPGTAPAAPQGPMAGAPQQPQAQPQVKHYDLKKGRYSVTVTVGKAKQSRLDAGNDALSNLMQAEPMLVPVIGPEWAKFQDWPGHEAIYELLKKMRDHQMPWLADPKEQPDAATQAQQLQAENQSLKQQLQQAAEFVKTEQAKHQAQIQIAQIKAQTDEAIAHINNAAKIEVARISAAKEAINQDAAAKEERLATGIELAHTAQEAAKDRAHDVALAAVAHQQALAQGQQDQAHEAAMGAAGAGQAAEQSAQDHQQGLEAGDAAHQQNLEAQAAAPQAETGG